MALFEFDDAGTIAALAAKMARESAQLGARAYAVTRMYGVKLQNQVRANASGRPGPRAQTGDYRRSIGLAVGRDRGALAATVGTNRPQGRRLELGFVGVDSLGRSYNQPPYPHLGPALDKVAPEYQQAIADLVGDVLE